MWHEARKQEKKIRGMIVDYRKRADRRKEFYERIVSRLCLYSGFVWVLFKFCLLNSELIQLNSCNFMDANARLT